MLHFYVFVMPDGWAINAPLILMTACPIPATMTEVVPMGLICFLANAQKISLAKTVKQLRIFHCSYDCCIYTQVYMMYDKQ